LAAFDDLKCYPFSEAEMMKPLSKICVTGAYGFSGRYIAEKFISNGYETITLTGHPETPSSRAPQIKAFPFDFLNVSKMKSHLEGCDVFINTYWVRFDYRQVTFERAVRNSFALIDAARLAGVRRFIHISITNAHAQSVLPYFRGKGLVEEYLRESGLSYAILRPAVIFGDEDILINNLAYILRRFPLFTIPGQGDYQLQPIFVADLAEICFREALSDKDITLDAIGPETFTFRELVRLVCTVLEKPRLIIPVPAKIAFFLVRALSLWLGDNLLTWDEIQSLSSNLLCTSSQPSAFTRLSQWLIEHKDTIGIHYASELKRHYRRS